jgi:hypothetical protein
MRGILAVEAIARGGCGQGFSYAARAGESATAAPEETGAGKTPARDGWRDKLAATTEERRAQLAAPLQRKCKAETAANLQGRSRKCWASNENAKRRLAATTRSWLLLGLLTARWLCAWHRLGPANPWTGLRASGLVARPPACRARRTPRFRFPLARYRRCPRRR